MAVARTTSASATVDVLTLFSYPLHPPGKPERARDRASTAHHRADGVHPRHRRPVRHHRGVAGRGRPGPRPPPRSSRSPAPGTTSAPRRWTFRRWPSMRRYICWRELRRSRSIRGAVLLSSGGDLAVRRSEPAPRGAVPAPGAAVPAVRAALSGAVSGAVSAGLSAARAATTSADAVPAGAVRRSIRAASVRRAEEDQRVGHRHAHSRHRRRHPVQRDLRRRRAEEDQGRSRGRPRIGDRRPGPLGPVGGWRRGVDRARVLRHQGHRPSPPM